jgi:hypothetical protein
VKLNESMILSPMPKAKISSAAVRMRRHRQRRREGLRSLTIELRETEIDALIWAGFLEDAERRLRLGAKRRRRPGARITADPTTMPVAMSLAPTTPARATALVRPRCGVEARDPVIFDS